MPMVTRLNTMESKSRYLSPRQDSLMMASINFSQNFANKFMT
jgi:hypothetical protein